MKRFACEDECDPGRSKNPSKEDPRDVPERTPQAGFPCIPEGIGLEHTGNARRIGSRPGHCTRTTSLQGMVRYHPWMGQSKVFPFPWIAPHVWMCKQLYPLPFRLIEVEEEPMNMNAM
eukprot:scaffold818_cov388-Pavlova_lutheri.AAC.16